MQEDINGEWEMRGSGFQSTDQCGVAVGDTWTQCYCLPFCDQWSVRNYESELKSPMHRSNMMRTVFSVRLDHVACRDSMRASPFLPLKVLGLRYGALDMDAR